MFNFHKLPSERELKSETEAREINTQRNPTKLQHPFFSVSIISCIIWGNIQTCADIQKVMFPSAGGVG